MALVGRAILEISANLPGFDWAGSGRARKCCNQAIAQACAVCSPFRESISAIPLLLFAESASPSRWGIQSSAATVTRMMSVSLKRECADRVPSWKPCACRGDASQKGKTRLHQLALFVRLLKADECNGDFHQSSNT